MKLIKWIQFSILTVSFGRSMAIPDREQTDYCEMFGRDDIQGKPICIFIFFLDLTSYTYIQRKETCFSGWKQSLLCE